MDRLAFNKQIVEKLSQIVDKYPELRFNQILINTGIVIPNSDQFYEESETTFERFEFESQMYI